MERVDLPGQEIPQSRDGRIPESTTGTILTRSPTRPPSNYPASKGEGWAGGSGVFLRRVKETRPGGALHRAGWTRVSQREPLDEAGTEDGEPEASHLWSPSE